jgi:hypothetical protein
MWLAFAVLGGVACGRPAADPRAAAPTRPPSVFGDYAAPVVLGAPMIRRPLHAAVLETRDGMQVLPDMRPTIGAIAVTGNGATLVTADRPPVRGWPASSDPGCVVWERASAQAVAQLGDQSVAAVAIAAGGALEAP